MMNAMWLPGLNIMDTADEPNCMKFLCTSAKQADSCPKCGVVDHFYKHGIQQIGYRDIPAYGKQTFIVVDVQRYRCRDCGATFNQSIPHMDSRRQMTERCVQWVATKGVTDNFSSVAREVGVDEKTVRNICIPEFQRRLAGREIGDKLSTPTILGPVLRRRSPSGDPSRLRKYVFALFSSLHSTLKNSVWCVEITVFSRLSGLLSSFAR